MLVFHMLGGFDFISNFCITEHGIHFFFVISMPIGYNVTLVIVSFVCDDFLHHEVFKGVSIIIGASLQGVTSHQGVSQTDVKIVELGSLDYLPLDFFPERWNFIFNTDLL